MILIDSLYINNGGGKILLEYLIKKIEEITVQNEVFFLLDKRNEAEFKRNKNRLFLKATLIDRYKFYKENRNKFKTILCFGNLAPPIKTNATVYTYFHQRLFLSTPSNISLREQLTFKVKSSLFSYFLKNTDFVVVQTNNIKEELCKQIKFLKTENILIKPFYEPLDEITEPKKIKNNNKIFLYVSSGASHKNHKRLLNAFSTAYLKHRVGKLIVTIDSQAFPEINIQIQEEIRKGVKIENIGYVSKTELVKYYQTSEFLIYPSLSESFGLGILEALDFDCKIIGSNLPYIEQVCVPSLKFDPYSIEDISKTIEFAMNNQIKQSEKMVKNEMDDFLKIILKK